MKIVLPIAAALLAPVAAMAQAPAPASPAAQAAQRWVALLDAGDYAGSWRASGALFQSRGDQAGWAQAADAARKPLGAVSTRVVLDEKPTATLPGAPDGHYAVIRFATSFAQKRGATETVILANEGGTWKVDGYFVS